MFKLFSHGILGMNARNLKYIRTKNSRESMSLADSKLKTKHFLTSRGIPFAETYVTLSSQQELQEFSLASLQTDEFVIKPNRGSQGKGILIVRKVDDAYIIDGKIWSEDDIKLHMVDILHGSFSLHGSHDTVVIEELLTPGKEFARYCRHGLADIRIIVYNYVPMTAMIRMPTATSGGKANLAQGGIGLGLGIADGRVISLSQDKVSYTRVFPPEYSELKGKSLPYWNDILLYSAQVQAYTKLGYLALDWVITKNGPRLLEINARAGLEIQNVNLIPLAARLNQVEGLRIHSPEKGVEVAKTLFHTERQESIVGKKVIYLEQPGRLEGTDITLRVDLSQKQSTLSADLSDTLLDGVAPRVEFADQSISLSTYIIDAKTKNTITLGTVDLDGYLIHPTRKQQLHRITQNERWPQDVYDLDEAVYRLSRRVNLSSLLRPENYSMELDTYIANPVGYNPIFRYRFPDAKKIQIIHDTVALLREKAIRMSTAGVRIGDLYTEKLREIEEKIYLVEAYATENYSDIKKYNELLFGKTKENLLYDAREKVLSGSASPTKKEQKILGKVLTLDEVTEHIHEYFQSHDLQKIPISIESSNLSRMSIAYGKEVKIKLSSNAIFRENELPATLAHEIGTHFRRYLNGRELGLKIFQFGTGYYLSDEEGFAIYQSLAHLPDGYEKNAMYIKYYLLSAADTLSFSETLDLVRSLYPGKSPESLFSDTVRLKRGISRTEVSGVEGTTYQKDKIYLDGYTRIQAWIDAGGDTRKLLYGKIKLADLNIIEFL